MPHVIVKFHAGRSDEEKRAMADAVADALYDTMGYDIASVSVVVEEVAKEAWMETVYGPDIVARQTELVKWPGYGPLADRAPDGPTST